MRLQQVHRASGASRRARTDRCAPEILQHHPAAPASDPSTDELLGRIDDILSEVRQG